ncbi:hypothetical protein AMATHDRAFT_142806 [Amanita thiersii Skay4041]|uniref:Pentatricopeptide repeat-containing protein-mitochondrial domain-containing protein n=1 Tax=Amanita thiersii Skay4041 TaxID=703135 RepID=A0A2A9NSR1_9AGAR|nr:hypothetical protein AMATHDRAFT_142806 [Amanita thiersii Skay4041]
MVEPFASVVFNSLLSARTSFRQSTFNISIAAPTAYSSPKKYVKPDFFTPVPRRGRAKETATLSSADQSYLEHLSECKEWSCCPSIHSVWCPMHRHKRMLEEFFTIRTRSIRSDSCRIPGPIHSRGRTQLHRAVHSHQRRHSSHTSEAVRMIAPHFASSEGHCGPTGALYASTSAPSSSSSHKVAGDRMQCISKLGPEEFNLDEAWKAYLEAVESGALSAMSPDVLLTYMERVLMGAERLCDRKPGEKILVHWRDRFTGALEAMESHVSPSSAYDRRRLCLLARSAALADHCYLAIAFVRQARKLPPHFDEDYDLVHTYKAIILTLCRYYKPAHAIDYMIKDWAFISPLLYENHIKAGGVKPSGQPLHATIHRILAQIPNPAVLLTEERRTASRNPRALGIILLQLYCEARSHMQAFNIYNELIEQQVYVPTAVKLRLIQALARGDAFEVANKLFEPLAKSQLTRHLLTAGIQLYALQGNTAKVELYYKHLERHNWEDKFHKTMYIHAYAIQGMHDQALALFNKFYPEDANGRRLNTPDLFTFTTLIHGLAKDGDLERINVWLEAMAKAGYRPDIYVFGSILQSFALRDDLKSAAAVLTQMRTHGVKPNAVIYTIIITLLARRKDASGAESVFNRALEEGVIPDRHMITAVMNAHVEAMSWKGVIRVFNRLKSTIARGLGIEIYNTLLKSYVNLGAPYSLVFQLFQKFESSFGVEPDAYSYSLVILSACDAQRVGVALNLFHKMDALPNGDKLISVYCLTVIMARYIKGRQFKKAKALIDEISRRGFEPTSVAIGTLLKGYGLYGRSRTEDSLRIAVEFVRSLSPKDASWNKPTADRKSALEHVYGPVLHAHARKGKPEDVEQVYQGMLDAGGRPTLGMLCLLLDSYRRHSMVDQVQRIWPHIVQLGFEYSDSISVLGLEDSASPSPYRLRDNILCVPLSIYIDAMSAAGYHQQVVEVWQDFKARGLGFDSHNWNHLAVALVRSGEVERAFELVEKVILPQEAEEAPQSSLKEEDDESSGFVVDNPSGPEKRRSKYKVSTRTTKLLRRDERLAEELSGDKDVARPLHILEQIAPSWDNWKPHNVLLQLLCIALARLESGQLVDPTRPDLENSHSDEPIDPIATYAKQREAVQLLEKIRRDYPQTVQLAMIHETRTRRRLGYTEYERRYAWN